MESIGKILGANLIKRRKALRLTQETLAERAGVSLFTIQAYEKARRWPELPYLDKIAGALGLETASLFQDYGNNSLTNEEILNQFAENLGYEIKKKS